jgi:hypothetical protein
MTNLLSFLTVFASALDACDMSDQARTAASESVVAALVAQGVRQSDKRNPLPLILSFSRVATCAKSILPRVAQYTAKYGVQEVQQSSRWGANPGNPCMPIAPSHG